MLPVGIWRIKSYLSKSPHDSPNDPVPVIQILVPLKGISNKSREILQTLLVQNYTNYRIMFILENDLDPAFELVMEFCSRHKHVELFLTGAANQCGQKNFGLAKAVASLDSEVEILVFCDSTNAASPDWLGKISRPVRSGDFEVCTTFRSFLPETLNVPGICQALYASTVFALLAVTPKPWGGATVIRKRTFDRLNVSNVWMHTVVDDLTLGNILNAAKVKIFVSPENFLSSPIGKQTLKGLLAFLDRQILFPKFTNPGIWIFTVLWHISLCSSLLLSSVGLISYFVGILGSGYAWLGALFWIGILALLASLRTLNQAKIPIIKWMITFPVLVFIATYVCVRSIFLDHIDWHGKRYYCGKGGVVIAIEDPRIEAN